MEGGGTDVEALRLLAPQRDRRAVDAKLEGIAAERRTQERDLGAFHEAEHHQPLYRRIGGIDRIDADSIARL
jgi:hypothetical protein